MVEDAVKEEARTFIRFRVEAPVYQQLEKFAELFHSKGAIVKPTIGALAKSCLFTQIKSFILAAEQDYRAQEAERLRQEAERQLQLQPLSTNWMNYRLTPG